MKSTVRNVEQEASTTLKAENSGHIPRSMTWREYCFYNDEGLTLQEIMFADAYTDTPDLIRAAIAADVEEVIAKAWGRVCLNKPQVKRRIEDNLAIARRSSVMSVRERQETLTSMARANVLDCVKITGDSIEIDIEKARKTGSHKGIVSLKFDEKEDTLGGKSRSRSIQMTNPISAIQELNKMQDVYNKKLKRTGAIVIIPSEDMNL
jgi:hypothetical protein